MKDADRISLLEQEVVVLRMLRSADQRLREAGTAGDILMNRKVKMANAEIDELHARIESLEAEDAGLAELEQEAEDERVKLTDATDRTTRLRNALLHVQADLRELAEKCSEEPNVRRKANRIHDIADRALHNDHDKPNPEEKTDAV